jgi:hypothetical protein
MRFLVVVGCIVRDSLFDGRYFSGKLIVHAWSWLMLLALLRKPIRLCEGLKIMPGAEPGNSMHAQRTIRVVLLMLMFIPFSCVAQDS